MGRELLLGGLGNDTLISDGGADVLRGGEGNDTLAIPDANFSGTRRLIGGSGVDTLRLDGAALSLDLTAIRDNRIVDVEIIDITGSGGNSLVLNFQEVINISSTTNTLLVLNDANDSIHIGRGWIGGSNSRRGLPKQGQ
jgi:Ca2+-binding RTX toxin-like protein